MTAPQEGGSLNTNRLTQLVLGRQIQTMHQSEKQTYGKETSVLFVALKCVHEPWVLPVLIGVPVSIISVVHLDLITPT